MIRHWKRYDESFNVEVLITRQNRLIEEKNDNLNGFVSDWKGVENEVKHFSRWCGTNFSEMLRWMTLSISAIERLSMSPKFLRNRIALPWPSYRNDICIAFVIRRFAEFLYRIVIHACILNMKIFVHEQSTGISIFIVIVFSIWWR